MARILKDGGVFTNEQAAKDQVKSILKSRLTWKLREVSEIKAALKGGR